MDFLTFKNIVIEKCQEMGIAEYELYYQAAESTSVSAFQQEINEFTSSTEGGVCFRCIVGGKMGYASTEELSEAQAAAIVARAADNAAILEAEEPVFLGEGGKTYRESDRVPYDLPTTEALIAKVLQTQESLYAANPAVIDGSQTEGIAERSETAIYNSKGLDLRSVNTLSGLVTAAVVSDGKEMTNNYEVKLGNIQTIDASALVSKAVDGALRQLGGDVAPTGQYPVIFNPEAMCNLLSVYASIFSSENAQKGLSKLNGREGDVIAAETVTLVDDPFHPLIPMVRTFDAEGTPTYTKNIIEKGKLNTLLYNLKTAAVAGRETTGNASKAGYDAPVGIRPFCLYVAPGDMTEEDLLAKAGNGVYITSLGGLHAGANPVTGDFSLQSNGFMIRGGKKAEPVKSFTIAGNFYDMLNKITALGNDLELGLSGIGAPSVLVSEIMVGGK